MAEVLRILRDKFEYSPKLLQETQELATIKRYVTPSQTIDEIDRRGPRAEGMTSELMRHFDALDGK